MAAKRFRPLPFPIYYWTVAGLCISGLINSIYLSVSHFRVHTDIMYASFCAVSKSINCDTVSQSSLSIFFEIPVPVWGVIGYSFFFLLLVFIKTGKTDYDRIWSLLFFTSICFSICSIILAYILRYHIKVYCIMCMLSYGINFLLLYFTWIVRRRFAVQGFIKDFKADISFLWRNNKKCSYIFAPFVVSIVLLFLFFPNYWNFEMPLVSSELTTGKTKEGSPWIGAENPELVITEFTDYMCFQCKKNHFYLRKIVSQYPSIIRLVHRHFPMDKDINPIVTTSFHQGSGKLAVAAVYAAHEGKFWEMNDLLYDIPRKGEKIDIKTLAEKSGVNLRGLSLATNISGIRYKIKHDIAQGMKLGIKGTPSYLINGEVYQGRIPIKVIKEALE
jgi:protein-disulfide isomerase/uncharacterized membrane protein